MKRAEEIKPLLSGMIRSFPFLSVKNQGFVPCKFATRQLIESVTVGLKKQAGGKAKWKSAFQSFEIFKKTEFSKKRVQKKRLWFDVRHVEGIRLLMDNFSFRQETFQQFPRKLAHHLPPWGLQPSFLPVL